MTIRSWTGALAAALLCAAPALAQERTSTPGAGIESGKANGLAGGRTDEGPMGGTGIRGARPGRQTRARARANAQARGPNPKGRFLRPAETPAQMNRDPKPAGSGAPDLPPDEEALPRGKNYGRRTPQGRAGGVASGRGNPSAASPHGSAGKGRQTQPPGHDSDAGK